MTTQLELEKAWAVAGFPGKPIRVDASSMVWVEVTPGKWVGLKPAATTHLGVMLPPVPLRDDGSPIGGTDEARAAMRQVYTDRVTRLGIVPPSILSRILALIDAGAMPWPIGPTGIRLNPFFGHVADNPAQGVDMPAWLPDAQRRAIWDQVAGLFTDAKRAFASASMFEAAMMVRSAAAWEGFTDVAVQVTEYAADPARAAIDAAGLAWGAIGSNTKVLLVGLTTAFFYFRFFNQPPRS